MTTINIKWDSDIGKYECVIDREKDKGERIKTTQLLFVVQEIIDKLIIEHAKEKD